MTEKVFRSGIVDMYVIGGRCAAWSALIDAGRRTVFQRARELTDQSVWMNVVLP